MVEGAHKIWKRPNTPFIFFRGYSAMFHVKHDTDGSLYKTRGAL